MSLFVLTNQSKTLNRLMTNERGLMKSDNGNESDKTKAELEAAIASRIQEYKKIDLNSPKGKGEIRKGGDAVLLMALKYPDLATLAYRGSLALRGIVAIGIMGDGALGGSKEPPSETDCRDMLVKVLDRLGQLRDGGELVASEIEEANRLGEGFKADAAKLGWLSSDSLRMTPRGALLATLGVVSAISEKQDWNNDTVLAVLAAQLLGIKSNPDNKEAPVGLTGEGVVDVAALTSETLARAYGGILDRA